MDNGAWAQNSLGPCSECGRMLPVGTLRYCVHCGAHVGADREATTPDDLAENRDDLAENRTVRLPRTDTGGAPGASQPAAPPVAPPTAAVPSTAAAPPTAAVPAAVPPTAAVPATAAVPPVVDAAPPVGPPADEAGSDRTVRSDPPLRGNGTPGKPGKPASWSDGEYRAPSPLDDVPDLSAPNIGDAWYSEAFLTHGHVVVPPTVPASVPLAPIVMPGGQPGEVKATVPGGVAVDGHAPNGMSPVPAGTAPGTDTVVQRPLSPATEALAAASSDPGSSGAPGSPGSGSQPEPWAQRSPRPESWPPNADALPRDSAPQLPAGQFPPAGFPPGPYQPGRYASDQYPPDQYPPGEYPPDQYASDQYPPGPFAGHFPPGDQTWQVSPGVDPEAPSHRTPLVAVVVAAVAIVVLAGAGLWWFGSRNHDHVTATSSGPAVTSSASVTVDPTTTASAAAEPTPEPSGTASSPGGDDADAALTSIDGLLARSTQARGQVGSTAVGLQSCQVDAEQAAKVFREAGEERKKLSSEASALAASPGVAAVESGGDIVRAFIALQDASAQADDALAAWADEVTSRGCSGRAPRTSNLDAANRFSAQATAAKTRFVKLWNPLASTHNLTARSADQI